MWIRLQSTIYVTTLTMEFFNFPCRNGKFVPGLEGRPLPEEASEPIVDKYLGAAAQYFQYVSDSERETPVPSGSASVSYHWSDSTLTGSFSGRCSSYSWGADEAVSAIHCCSSWDECYPLCLVVKLNPKFAGCLTVWSQSVCSYLQQVVWPTFRPHWCGIDPFSLFESPQLRHQ